MDCARRRRLRQAEQWARSHPDYRRQKYRRKGHVRRFRKRERRIESFTERSIFERDGWKCQICRKKIDPAARYPDPLSASLDHIVPLSQGGDHSRANVRASHVGCNVRRSNKGGNEQLALIG